MSADLQPAQAEAPARHRSAARRGVVASVRGLLAGISAWARARTVPLAWLGLALLLSPPATRLPFAGLDASWATGINLAFAKGLRFGPEIIYTFGPWGFLDAPVGLHPAQVVLGPLFAVVGVVALYAALYAALTRGFEPRFAAPIASLATVAAWPIGVGGRYVVAAVVASLLALLRPGAPRLLLTTSLSLAGVLLLQVKITYGVSVLLLAAVVGLAADSWRSAARNAAAGLGTGIAGFVGFWLLAGQRITDIPAYLRGSLEVSLGYAEAMHVEWRARSGYAVAAVIALVVVVATYRVVRGAQGRRVAAAGIVVATAGVLWLAAKHSFTQHYPSHEPDYDITAAVILIAFGAWLARRGRAIVVAGLLAITVALPGSAAQLGGTQPPSLSSFDPFEASRTWRTALEAVLNGYRNELAGARTGAAQAYDIPDELLAIVGDHPVQVDPWEAAVAWTYDLNWRPVPMFQQYSAYTPYLDELNARAIVEAPADQLILRNDAQALGGRNQLWDPPQYQLAVLCNYRVIATEGDWSVLRHGTDRCAGPRDLGSRRVEAGEVVDLPEVGANEVLVAHVDAQPPSLAQRAVELAFKPLSTVYATADGTAYRVPRVHLAGPLLLSVPAPDGTPATPYAGVSYQRLSLTVAGTIHFEAVPLR